MGDFPDPDEEFELMYGEELEMMKQMEEDEDLYVDSRHHPPSRRSLDFTSPSLASSVTGTSVQKPAPKPRSIEPVAGPSWLDDDFLTSLEESEPPPAPQTSLLDDNFPSTQKKLGTPARTSSLLSEVDSKKRKVQELFGDIDDIELEEKENKPWNKRKKKSLVKTVDADDELMKKIVSSRKQREVKYQTLVLPTSASQSEGKNADSHISKRVPKWPFVPVTTLDGDRLYVRKQSGEYLDYQIDSLNAQARSLGLLTQPYEVVWEQAQAYLQQCEERKKAAAFERRVRALEDSCVDSGCELMSEDESDKTDLWVEKYKPKNYLELLSDENVNRSLLHWLKLWDKVVFKRERKVKPKTLKEEKWKSDGSAKFTKFGMNDNLDEHGCPQQKLTLLCGPPGLGKTTLAHMIARHAGYNVVEMNASDDRSPEVFYTQLEAATKMRSVMGRNPRPNCLILDEIDGASAASIEVLVKYVTGKNVGKARGKKKVESSVLRRPVICICNDIYVPALRPLRQLALIFHFPPTSSSRLGQRLLEVCRKQGLRSDLSAMMALAEKTNNDIRSCMSLLQFFKAQGKAIKLSDVHRSSVGQKDMQKGLFPVWQEIFQIQRPKRKMGQIPSPADGGLEPMPDLNSPDMKCGPLSLAARMKSILQTVQSYGDYNLLSQGVFENYLNMKLRDSRMEGISLGLEWFCTTDILLEKINSTQNYTLLPYLPYSFVVWHFLYSSFSWPKITYPHASYEATAKSSRNQQILGELMKGMQPAVQSHAQKQTLLFDTLPMLLEILVPNLRPVSMQLYTAREKDELNQVINVMIDYNLNYTQERTAEGSYVYNLDPNIEEMCAFPGIKSSRSLTYSIKQVLSREVEMEKVRRIERKAIGEEVSGPKTDEKQEEIKPAVTKPAADKSETVIPNHLQKLKPKAIAAESTRVVKDFFGRAVECVETVEVASTKVDEIVKSDIWFHFKEGFSNAVRRSVKIHDLL
ncbi:chromosome transmission fidelity protein 18 homolog [Anabrus simplex]|uniref:chromosome transmission fidelity protein 18 homolog n=1 Tax=Anabrus simplex TaxID=316456 RepID=UPI0035A3C715